MISGMSIRQDALEQVCPVDQDQPACHPVGPRWLAEDVLEAAAGYLPWESATANVASYRDALYHRSFDSQPGT